jgi:type III secretory pathway lipoprotein EscJ
MKKIQLTDGKAISTLNDSGDGMAAITISENDITKAMVLLNANELAEFIRDLKEVYLSIAGY